MTLEEGIEKLFILPTIKPQTSHKETDMDAFNLNPNAGTGISSGVNFAIPVNTVLRTVPYLIVYGTPYADRF